MFGKSLLGFVEQVVQVRTMRKAPGECWSSQGEDGVSCETQPENVVHAKKKKCSLHVDH